MNLRKLPPSMLLALGLACGDKSDGDSTTVDACLSPPAPETSTGPCLDVESCLAEATGFPTADGTSTGGSSSTGGDESTFGPCLSPPEPTTGTDTGSGTGTGTDTDTGTGTGTGTTGMMGNEPPDTRAAAVGRVLERGALPADVADRLQRALDRARK